MGPHLATNGHWLTERIWPPQLSFFSSPSHWFESRGEMAQVCLWTDCEQKLLCITTTLLHRVECITRPPLLHRAYICIQGRNFKQSRRGCVCVCVERPVHPWFSGLVLSHRFSSSRVLYTSSSPGGKKIYTPIEIIQVLALHTIITIHSFS